MQEEKGERRRCKKKRKTLPQSHHIDKAWTELKD